jgi:hypothetical protein
MEIPTIISNHPVISDTSNEYSGNVELEKHLNSGIRLGHCVQIHPAAKKIKR